MGKTIYVVTSGSYSDYGINAVYDDKELAERAIAMGIGDTIEEYEANIHADLMREGRFLYSITAWPEHDRVSVSRHFGAPEPLTFSQIVPTTIFYKPYWQLSGTVEATDTYHAEKIVAEKMAQIKVEGGAPGVTVVPSQQVPTS